MKTNAVLAVPFDLIIPLQIAVSLGGFLIALLVASRKAFAANPSPRQALLELLPWAVTFSMLAVAASSIFNLPTEMRATSLTNR
jgi:hypothetical protein